MQRTDIMKLIVAFRSVANVYKRGYKKNTSKNLCLLTTYITKFQGRIESPDSFTATAEVRTVASS
jgi:hypothetical protein